MTEIRPDVLLQRLASLPAGRVTVLPPAIRPPPAGTFCWQPQPAVVQVVLEGELPHAEAGGGILGPAVLRPGDVLVAMTGSWSRRRYRSGRSLLSLPCLPGAPWLDIYRFVPPRRPGRPPDLRLPLHAPAALRLACEALAACPEPGAAANLGLAIAGLLRRTAAAVGVEGEGGLCRRVRAWMAERALAGGSRHACAAALGIHPDHLTRCLRRHGGSWSRELLELRLRAARERLLAGDAVAAAARACGWTSTSHFIAVFRRAHAATPQRWRDDQRAS